MMKNEIVECCTKGGGNLSCQ